MTSKQEVQLIGKAIKHDDLDDAVAVVMDALGIKTGDIAGMYFDGGNRGETWGDDTPKERFQLLSGYIAYEETWN